MSEINLLQHPISFKTPTPHGFTIYTKTSCSYCTKIKELLDKNNIEYHIINCDIYLEYHKDLFLDFIKNQIGYEYRTFPMVFLHNCFLGGFTETEKYIEEQNTYFHDDF